MTFIDLFCGCGGFSLGMVRAGFRCLAAIDFNQEAITTFKANFPDTLAFCKDLTKFPPDRLTAKLGVNHVDVIVGGPPCQGFSTVRQVDSANHGSRVRKDKRRYLFRSFLDYVSVFRPRLFVMENVLGIQSAAKGKFFTLVQSEARKLGYRVHAQVEEAWKLGVPQKRRRQLIIGVRNDLPGFFPSELTPCARAKGSPKLWDAIGDLPEMAAGGGSEECDYDLALRKDFLTSRGETARNYLENVLEVNKARKLTCHRARPHNDRDIGDFRRLREGETADAAIARGEKMEFPYDRSIFLDRYTRQHRENICSTIVAHLSKDGLMFIHPTQDRSLTPREAARVQTFPDWFRFPVPRTHQFRIIGNAVPPLIAECIGAEIRIFLEGQHVRNCGETRGSSTRPDNIDGSKGWKIQDAARALQSLARLDRRQLRNISAEQFIEGWRALIFLFPDLHPDSALDHGEQIEEISPDQLTFAGFEEIVAKRYSRSGWPVALALLGLEAWHRYEAREISTEAFYCLDAQSAGLNLRKNHSEGIRSKEVKA